MINLCNEYQEALDQLRHESLELYLEAIQFDPELIPFQASGPTLTPAIKDYIQVSIRP